MATMDIVVETRGGTSSDPSGTSETDPDHITTSFDNNPEVTLRQRRTMGSGAQDGHLGGEFVFLELPENEVEEHKMTQNHMVSKYINPLNTTGLNTISDWFIS